MHPISASIPTHPSISFPLSCPNTSPFPSQLYSASTSHLPSHLNIIPHSSHPHITSSLSQHLSHPLHLHYPDTSHPSIPSPLTLSRPSSASHAHRSPHALYDYPLDVLKEREGSVISLTSLNSDRGYSSKPSSGSTSPRMGSESNLLDDSSEQVRHSVEGLKVYSRVICYKGYIAFASIGECMCSGLHWCDLVCGGYTWGGWG